MQTMMQAIRGVGGPFKVSPPGKYKANYNLKRDGDPFPAASGSLIYLVKVLRKAQ